MKQSRDPMRGIFLRGKIYYFQPAQENKVRPPMITLETSDPKVAIAKADRIRAIPILNPSTRLLAEVREHLKQKLKRREYSRSTADNKLMLLKRWIKSMPHNTSLATISTGLLQSQYDDRLESVGIATAHKFIMTIRAFLAWAVNQGKIRENPAVAVNSLPVPPAATVRFCDRALRDSLINECPRLDLKYVLMMGFHAGLRKNEIIQSVKPWFLMDGRVLDLRDTATFRFNDKKRRRTIPMRRVLFEFIRDDYGLRETFMLRPEVRHGKGLYRYDFQKPFAEYMKEKKVPWVTPHVMRHTFASLLVMGDRAQDIRPASIYKVAKWLGDTVTVTETTYAHLAPRDEDIEED